MGLLVAGLLAACGVPDRAVDDAAAAAPIGGGEPVPPAIDGSGRETADGSGRETADGSGRETVDGSGRETADGDGGPPTAGETVADGQPDGDTAIGGGVGSDAGTIADADADADAIADADADGVGDDGADGPIAVVVRRGGIDAGLVERIRAIDGVTWLSLVETGQVHLVASHDHAGRPVDQPPTGFVIQLEARAYTGAEVVAELSPDLARALGGLGDGEVMLSASSAGLRRLGVGGTLTFDNGSTARVGAVVPDDLVGNAEAVFVGPGALEAAGAASPRTAALVRYRGTGAGLEALLRWPGTEPTGAGDRAEPGTGAASATDGGRTDGGRNDASANGGGRSGGRVDAGVRVFGGRGDSQRDRGRGTLPAIEVKQRFGEFAFRPEGASAVRIEPDWVEANIVTVDLPVVGSTRCHRLFAEALTGVLQSLVDDGLADVIDPQAFQGCWNPRRIAGSARLSKHAWGIAADINFGNALDEEPGSPVHPELLSRMLDAGVTSGHLWRASPDPGHFEYRGDD